MSLRSRYAPQSRSPGTSDRIESSGAITDLESHEIFDHDQQASIVEQAPLPLESA